MSVRRKGGYGIAVVSALGDFFGGSETDELRDAIRSELASGNLKLVLDLSGCRALNTNALSVLVEARSAYESRGGEVKLCGIGNRVQGVLEKTRLIDLFERHPGTAEAEAAFSRSPLSRAS